VTVVLMEAWEMHVVERLERLFWWELAVVLLGSGGSKTPVAAEAVEDACGRVVIVLWEAEHWGVWRWVLCPGKTENNTAILRETSAGTSY